MSSWHTCHWMFDGWFDWDIKLNENINFQAGTSANAWTTQRSWCHACRNDNHFAGHTDSRAGSIGWVEETTLSIIFGKLFHFNFICDKNDEYSALNLFSQLVTLIGLWIVPICYCVKNLWWRFIFFWLLFSCITLVVIRKAIAKPIAGTTPRWVYKYWKIGEIPIQWIWTQVDLNPFVISAFQTCVQVVLFHL